MARKKNIKKNNWVFKTNALNEVRNSPMSMPQLKLFSIYLSKINPKDESTREVTLSLDDYARLAELQTIHTTRIVKTAKDLLNITVVLERGKESNKGLREFKMCQLFKTFQLKQDEESGQWIVIIDCHDDLLPYLFNMKEYYFKYRLWNILQLHTVNQLRMYEILKQYEYIGEREISVDFLKELLGIGPNTYKRFNDFKVKVLDACQQALSSHTDITYTYKLIKSGRGGKTTAIRFFILKNENYQDKHLKELGLDIPIDVEEVEVKSDYELNYSEDQIAILVDIVKHILPDASDDERMDYINRKNREILIMRKPTNPYQYLKKALENEEKESKNKGKSNNPKNAFHTYIRNENIDYAELERKAQESLYNKYHKKYEELKKQE